MAIARLELLGGFRLLSPGNQEIVISAKKNQGILAILGMSQGRLLAREKIVSLLWGDRDEDQARASLRQSLVVLRRELGSLVAHYGLEGDQLGMKAEGIEVDGMKLLALAQHEGLDALRDAARLVRGPFLDGLSIRSDFFEAWVRNERELLNDAAIAVFTRLADIETGKQQIETAKRLVELDPLREVSHRALLRAYVQQGERVLAQSHYKRLSDLMWREFGVRPSEETDSLLARMDRKPAATIADPPEPRAGRLTIVVMPFANLSNLPEQTFLCMGLTNDIITELSRFGQLVVRLAPGGSGNQPEDRTVAESGRSQGAHYVLDGSLRRIGGQLRIGAQLIDSESGQLVWAERFDRGEGEIFAIQDQVVHQIVSTLVGRVHADSAERAKRTPPASLAAYELFLQADSLPFYDREANAEAERLCRMALEIDPGYARALSLLAAIGLHNWYDDADAGIEALTPLRQLAERAVSLDPNESYCRAILGDQLVQIKQFDQAEHHYRKCLSLNPNRPVNVAVLGRLYTFMGEPERAEVYYAEASQLDPYFDRSWYWNEIGYFNFIAGRYDEAVAAMNKSSDTSGWIMAYCAAFSLLAGKPEDARDYANRARQRDPKFSSAKTVAKDPFKNPQHTQLLLESLIKAGLPP